MEICFNSILINHEITYDTVKKTVPSPRCHPPFHPFNVDT